VYIAPETNALMAYKVAKGLAVALEGPVCEKKKVKDAILSFEAFCQGNGWKPCYFMVDEDGLNGFSPFNKKKILFGREGILEVGNYAKEKDRTGYFSKGLTVEMCKPPHSKAFLDDLHAISNEWLGASKRKEMGFYAAVFDADELKNQSVLVARYGLKREPVAFLSVVTRPNSRECTVGLFRLGNSAPFGCEEALIDGLVDDANREGYLQISLGIASSIGVIEPENMPERIQHYITNRFKPLKDFQNQRAFLEKYATGWKNRYLLYESDYDLFLIPVALRKVIRQSDRFYPKSQRHRCTVHPSNWFGY
jgi:phosphatidylglycerol lysyltransferase